MRLYIFKSESRSDLRAFAPDGVGAKLPKNFAPWRVIGMVSPNRAPPHRLPRARIEEGINTAGYQLWRVKAKANATAPVVQDATG